MCNCKEELEAKHLAKFKQDFPEMTNHFVELEGYTFIFSPKAYTAACLQVTREADWTFKNGGFRKVKKSIRMIFTYCPFCGKEYAPNDKPEEKNETQTPKGDN